MRPSSPRPAPLKSALKSTLKSTLVSAACVGAGCVSTPTPRPVRPTECPPGSEETLRRFGIKPGAMIDGVMEPSYAYPGIMPPTIAIKEGPWTGYVLTTQGAKGDLKPNSKLKGVLLFERGGVLGYFTQLQPRDTAEELPICLTWSSRFLPESRPGKPLVYMFVNLQTVSSFE